MSKSNAYNADFAVRWAARHRLLARQLLTGLPRPRRGYWSKPPGGRQPMPVVLYSQVAWDDVWQRPQELARGLARHRPVLFVSPVQVHQTAGALRGRWRAARLEAGGNLLVLCPQILTGEYRSAAVRRVNCAIVARALGPFLHRRPVLFLTNSPFCSRLIDQLKPALVGYDIMDDFCAFEWAPQEGRASEARILRRSSLVTAGTWAVREQFSRAAPGIEFLASGVDYEKLTRPASEPADLALLPRPRLLYVGTLNDRVSGDLVDLTAREVPHSSVVLVGPRRATFRAPAFPPNVCELGLKAHDELAGYYQHCDLGLMPFADNAAARAVNPIKTLEYLACGLPVISTPIPDVERFYVPPVVVAKPGDWPARIREMLEGNTDELRAGRKQFAQGRTWEKLVERMEEKIRKIEEVAR